MSFRRMRLSGDSFFLVQWAETNHTDLWIFDASYTKCLDLMNKLEHSDFDHCIKKLTVESPLSKFLHFWRTNFEADTLLYGKFITSTKMSLLVKRRNFQKTRLKFLFPFSIHAVCINT